MADKKYIGTFQSELEVLNKIDELKGKGFAEEDIYVVTNDTHSLSMVRGETDVDLRASEGNWMDRFRAFLTGDEPVKAAFVDMGFTEEESTHYYNEVKANGILLYVDRDYNHLKDNPLVHTPEDEIFNDDVDAHLDSNVNVIPEANVQGNLNTRMNNEEFLNDDEALLAHEEVNVENHATLESKGAAPLFDEEEEVLNNPILGGKVEETNRPVMNEELVVNHPEARDTETLVRDDADLERRAEVEDDYEVIDLETERERLRNDSLAGQNRLL